MQKIQYCRYLMAKHPYKKVFAFASQFSDVVFAVDSLGNNLFRLQGPKGITGKPGQGRETTYTFNDIECDSKYIYCLYIGNKLISSVHDGIIKNLPNKLFVYSWQGKPLASININEPFTIIGLDRETNRIYGFAENLGEIVYYDLPLGFLSN